MYAQMPWGQHKGRALANIETSYLLWVLYEASAAKEWLKAAIREELERRESAGGTHRGKAGPVANLKEFVTRWYRKMALRFHPDRLGGDGREMKAINAAAERLRELLGVAACR
jgi:hypothetical protein